jgi:hypothetical protein
MHVIMHAGTGAVREKDSGHVGGHARGLECWRRNSECGGPTQEMLLHNVKQHNVNVT